MKQKIIVYDLETTSVNAEEAIPRIMGFKSSEVKGFCWTTNIDEMVAILESHDVIVGYNNREYDNRIMERYGSKFYGKIIVDLMEIIHGKHFGNGIGRKSIMQDPDGNHLMVTCPGKTLDATTKALKGPLKIGDFDYTLFKKEWAELTPDEQKIAIEYLEADIDATDYIYQYVENFFENFKTGGIELDGEFKPFMTEEQIWKKNYITSSVASWTYKALCNLAGIEERYSDAPREDYGGGFVADPGQEVAEGDIYCLDYNSLYPHIMMMANLYGRIHMTPEDGNGWKGTGISETDGEYWSDNLAPVARVLQKLYKQRLEYKKGRDERQYTIKIIINTIYGLLGNPSFASVSDFTAAADCTRLGRQWVNAARLHFMEHGYTILYTDTDSVYLADPFNDKEKLLKVKEKHIQDIKASVPFPQDTFDMGIDDEIQYMAFFKGAQGNLLKKNYLYVTKEGKLKIKGMQIIKSTATKLGKLIFDKYIKPEILKPTRANHKRHTWKKLEIETWIHHELSKDISLAGVFYKIKEPEAYSVDSQIYSQIAKHKLYGPGQHTMLKLKTLCPHTKAAGKYNNYLGIQYADEITLGMIDISKTMQELRPFIEQGQKTLGVFTK